MRYYQPAEAALVARFFREALSDNPLLSSRVALINSLSRDAKLTL
jgi:hypothetical protein